MVRGAGGAPAPVERLPLWYLKAILRLVIRGTEWRQTDRLLEAALAEHEQVVALDDGSPDRFRAISARTLLLGGAKSRPAHTTALFRQLTDAIPDAAAEILPGLDHLGPEKAPDLVAARIERHLLGAEPRARAARL
jgi:pimeloyl-ACP methyl ester carboxylesterase